MHGAVLAHGDEITQQAQIQEIPPEHRLGDSQVLASLARMSIHCPYSAPRRNIFTVRWTWTSPESNAVGSLPWASPPPSASQPCPAALPHPAAPARMAACSPSPPLLPSRPGIRSHHSRRKPSIW